MTKLDIKNGVAQGGFKHRLFTLLVLIPLVLLIIYSASPRWIHGTVVVLMMACGYEWLQLIPIRRAMHKVFFMMLLLTSIFACWQWFHAWLFISLTTWGIIFLFLITFPRTQQWWGSPWIIAGFCLLLLPSFGNSMVAIYAKSHGKDLMVYLLCLVWAADIGAYVAGKCIGKHKLIVNVSPGKTIEGAISGFCLALGVLVMGYWYFYPSDKLVWVASAFGTVLIAMIGDLFISMLKRRSKIKDTGSILPGHGGILDRLDSLIAASPLFYCMLTFCLPEIR